MRRYRRFFVMFELEDKNFGIFASEESRGYAKFEIRNNHGLLSIYCQSLKGSNGNRYQWYLIDTKTDGAPTIVEIGFMEVDERGKGEITCEFNAENVKGSMVQIDDFNILALIVQNRDEEDKLYAPLVGYIDKKRPDVSYWRYALGKYLHIPIDEGIAKGKTAQFYRPAKKIEEKPIAEITGEVTEEAAKEPIREEAKEIEEKVAEKIIEKTVEEPIKETAEEVEVIEETVEEVAEETTEGVIEETAEESIKETVEEIEIIEGVVKEKAAKGTTEQIVEETIRETVEGAKGAEEEAAEEATEETAEKIIEEPPKEVEEKVAEEVMGETIEKAVEDDYEIQMQAYIENSLKGFLEVEPFVDKLGNYVWWQIPHDVQTMYRAYMPFISYLDSLKEPMDQADYYVSRMAQIVYIHQHHIFGICYDENNRARYYAYGILGRNLSMEQPFELDEDFVYWHPCDNVPSNIESYGYWILTIDPKTGDAVKCK